MTTYSVTYNKYAAFLFLFISPLLTIPYLLLGIYRREKSAFFLFSLSLGLFAWLQIPSADLLRHSISAYDIATRTLDTILNDDLNPDFIIPLFNWLILNSGLPYQLLRLITTTEAFWLLTIIFNNMIEKSPRLYTRQEVFIRFIIMYLFFEFIQTVNGVRYGFALYQFIFSLHLFFNKKNYLGAVLFALFAAKIHVSFSFIIPFTCLVYIICNTRKKIALLFLSSPFFLLLVIKAISPFMGRRADWYFDGGSSVTGDNIANSTIYGVILFMGIRLFLIPFAFLCYKYFNKKLHWIRLGTVFTIFILLFISNGIMIFRFSLLLAAVGCFVLLQVESFVKLKKSLIQTILIFGIFTCMFNTINYRNIILKSHYEYAIFPVPFILNYQYDYKDLVIEYEKSLI